MARTNLTEPQVKKFKHTGTANQSFLRDTAVNGLAVRVTATNKAYVFERRHNKRLFRVLIGDTSSYTLAQAREKAREIGVMIDAGQDPQQKKKDQEAAQEREKLTVEDAWKAFLKYHKSQWSDEHYDITVYHARAPEEGKTAGILWPLLQMKMSDITALAMVKWAEAATKDFEKKLKSINTKRQAALRKAKALEEQVEGLQKSGDKEKAQALLNEIAKLKSKRFSNIRGNNAALRHGYMRFSAFWNWASQREEYAGFASPDILKHPDLKRLLPTTKPKKDVLEKGQLKAWFEVVRAIDNKVISAYLQVLLLTGARRNELATFK